jgi:DnaJ-class molecular chaperone
MRNIIGFPVMCNSCSFKTSSITHHCNECDSRRDRFDRLRNQVSSIPAPLHAVANITVDGQGATIELKIKTADIKSHIYLPINADPREKIATALEQMKNQHWATLAGPIVT